MTGKHGPAAHPNIVPNGSHRAGQGGASESVRPGEQASRPAFDRDANLEDKLKDSQGSTHISPSRARESLLIDG